VQERAHVPLVRGELGIVVVDRQRDVCPHDRRAVDRPEQAGRVGGAFAGRGDDQAVIH
jgi:hypothetical protein